MENREIHAETGIDGLAVEPQPIFGNPDGAVLHLIPGGTDSPEMLDGGIRDVYASMAIGRGIWRGGHYHGRLDEFFFVMSGRAVWLFVDMRPESRTSGRHYLCVVDAEARRNGAGSLGPPVPEFSVVGDMKSYRLRVPAGVYHAYAPLGEGRVMILAVGNTPFDGQDYFYPDIRTVGDSPALHERLEELGLEIPKPTR
ncbi:dTDP-4-dehydrorhamnose 3,5-epimerase family protein [Candidatus Uhrbacteria bacterium]|nr:dTDP-4-dehydrorhamnose 3,5-epimerase family protein [Candidatus Uhrbacteria bacterium]